MKIFHCELKNLAGKGKFLGLSKTLRFNSTCCHTDSGLLFLHWLNVSILPSAPALDLDFIIHCNHPPPVRHHCLSLREGTQARARPFRDKRHKAIKPQRPQCTTEAHKGQNIPDFKPSQRIWYFSLGGKEETARCVSRQLS